MQTSKNQKAISHKILSCSVEYEIHTQGSKRIVQTRRGPRLIEDNEIKHKAYRKAVNQVMGYCKPDTPFDCALHVSITLFIPRLKSHHLDSDINRPLKKSAPRMPYTGLDIDKVTRSIFDSGTGAWWVNDSRICSLTVKRVYIDARDKMRTEIKCWPIEY